jgi:hypothetical protein
VKKSCKISGRSAIGLKGSFVSLIFLSYLLILKKTHLGIKIQFSLFFLVFFFWRRESVTGFWLRKLALWKI